MRLIDSPSSRVWRVLRHQLAPATAAAALVAAVGLYLNWSEPALPGFARAAALAAPALVIQVVDGDTIDAVVPPSHQLLRYRLIGFETPETYYAQCDEERSLGYRAAGRLEQLVQDAGVQTVRFGAERPVTLEEHGSVGTGMLGHVYAASRRDDRFFVFVFGAEGGPGAARPYGYRSKRAYKEHRSSPAKPVNRSCRPMSLR